MLAQPRLAGRRAACAARAVWPAGDRRRAGSTGGRRGARLRTYAVAAQGQHQTCGPGRAPPSASPQRGGFRLIIAGVTELHRYIWEYSLSVISYTQLSGHTQLRRRWALDWRSSAAGRVRSELMLAFAPDRDSIIVITKFPILAVQSSTSATVVRLLSCF